MQNFIELSAAVHVLSTMN